VSNPNTSLPVFAPNCLGRKIAGMTIDAPRNMNTNMTPTPNMMLFWMNAMQHNPEKRIK